MFKNNSLSWEYYAQQRGEWFYPEEVLRRLTYKVGLRHLFEDIQIDETPFLRKFFNEKHEALSSSDDLEPVEVWQKRVALLGLLCSRWNSRKLPVPPDWIEGIGFAKKEYTLDMVQELSPWAGETYQWEHKFEAPSRVHVAPGKENPWTLREQLGQEFAKLYFDKAREIIHAISKAATPETTLRLHRQLREHVDEASWYDACGVREAIRLKLPEFSAEFATSTDPAVRFCCVALNEICNYKAERSRPACKILIEAYWERLREISKGAEAKRLIDLLQFEVTELIEAQEAINEKGSTV